MPKDAKMCLAVPGRVLSVDGGIATVDIQGSRVLARTDVVSARPGDYVISYMGLIVEILDPAEADARLRSIRAVASSAPPA